MRLLGFEGNVHARKDNVSLRQCDNCLFRNIHVILGWGYTINYQRKIKVIVNILAVLFLELWKRYSAEITHRWDLSGFDIKEEHPRPQYLARLAHVKRKHLNVITNTEEPCVPFWRTKLPATILSFSVVLLLVDKINEM